MPRLTADDRKRLLDRTFGLPAQRKYPMPDAAHAANAKARATQQLELGHLTPDQAAQIRRKADQVLRS